MPLVANDGSWAICMPKKTGSQSLHGMLSGAAEIVGEFHGGEWEGTGKRVMVVREPYERLASMYWFSLSTGIGLFMGEGGAAKWLDRFVAGFAWKHKPAYAEWVLSQSELAEQFRPVVVCRLEDGLEKVFDVLGLEQPTHIHRANITKGKHSDRRPFAETFTGASAAALAAVESWCRPDLEAWY